MDFESAAIAKLLASLTGPLGSTMLKLLRDKLSPQLADTLPTEVKTKSDIRKVETALYREKRNNRIMVTRAEGGARRRGTAPIQSREAQPEPGNFPQDVLDDMYQSGAKIRDERLRQAKGSFNLAAVLAAAGVILHFIGAYLAFTDKVGNGALTAVAGVVPDVISGLLFKFNSETNDRLEETRKDLAQIERAKVAMKQISHITDEGMRNNAIKELTESLHRKN